MTPRPAVMAERRCTHYLLPVRVFLERAHGTGCERHGGGGHAGHVSPLAGLNSPRERALSSSGPLLRACPRLGSQFTQSRPLPAQPASGDGVTWGQKVWSLRSVWETSRGTPDLHQLLQPPSFIRLLGRSSIWGRGHTGHALRLFEQEPSRAWVPGHSGRRRLMSELRSFKVTVTWGLCYLQPNVNSAAGAQGAGREVGV